MIQIHMAVSDDDIEVCHTISAYAKELGRENSCQVTMEEFSCGSDLINSDFQKYKMIFLDIETDGINGLETAGELRKKGFYGEIVFISAIPKYCAKGYRYKAYRFLIKPISYEDFSFELRELFIYLRTKEEFSGSLAGKTEIPEYWDIFYIEVIDHTIIYHGSKKTVQKTGSMRVIEEKYLPLGFCRIHQSYLVNMDKIEKIYSGKVLLANQTELSISRSRAEQFMDRYASFCMERM